MRKIAFMCIGLLAVAITAWAGDPWKLKAYKDWDENELKRILYDSPWAKKVSITSSGGMPSAPGGPPPGAPAAGSGSYTGGSTAGGTPQPVNVAAGKMMNELSYTVRWFSAMTMRRAIARDAVRRHGLTEEQAGQGLAAPVDDHVILVLGPGLYVFQDFDEAALMKFTFLRPRKSKNKLFPSKVLVQRKADAKTIDFLVFHFAKKLENGELTIPMDEKSIDFSCEPKAVSIHVTFEPPKMVAQEGPDW